MWASTSDRYNFASGTERGYSLGQAANVGCRAVRPPSHHAHNAGQPRSLVLFTNDQLFVSGWSEQIDYVKIGKNAALTDNSYAFDGTYFTAPCTAW